MSLPLASVIEALKSTPTSVIPILCSLHNELSNLSSVSKVDLKHLTSRSLNLCKSNDPYSVWCGINIVTVLSENPTVLGTEGSAFFVQLLKVLNSPVSQDPKIFTSTVECLNKLCDNIRGKPTLTREVLTPNLNGIFSGLMSRLNENPVLVLSSLKVLIEEHPTTARPFANKLKQRLLDMISNEGFLNSPESLIELATTTLACLPIIEKEDCDQFWLNDVNRIISNLASTFDVYSNFITIQEDDDIVKSIAQLSSDSVEIFSPMDIDINQPTTLFVISKRITLLFELLKGYLASSTRFTVVVPIGKVIASIEVLCSIDTKFLSFKREIREPIVKEYVNTTLVQSYEAAISVLSSLPRKYSSCILPHMSSVLASLESLIAMNNKRLDYNQLLANESLMRKIIICCEEFFTLVTYFPDYPALSRVVEAALLLVQSRGSSTPSQNSEGQTKLSQQSKAARKKAKQSKSVPLADLLSHEHLFQQSVPEETKKVVFRFLSSVIKKVPLASTQYNKLLKITIHEAVKYCDQGKYKSLPADLQSIILSCSLHPAPEAASILPMATTLLPNSELLGVFNSPRFPPLPYIVKSSERTAESSSDEEEDEQTAEVAKSTSEPPAKRMKKLSFKDEKKVEEPASPANENIFKAVAVPEVPAQTDVQAVAEEPEMEVEEVVEATVTTEGPESSQDESDGDSEIEIPELDLEGDSDEEK